ncbi:hypothetical protein Tco_1578725 [Tanacetum coccineum]
MATLEFCDKHNMVAYLEKPEGSAEFHQIIDFLTASHIHYALTENPTIYASFIKQFWTTATASTNVNGEVELTASIDGQAKTITEASLRRHLKLEDNGGITSLPNIEIFEQLALMGYATDSDKLTFQKGNFSPQWSVHLLGRDEGSVSLNELMDLVTQLNNKVRSLENELTNTKKVYGSAITKLVKRVKKLEKQVKTDKARRRTKIVLSEDEAIEEDSSKLGRSLIKELDMDADFSLVPLHAEIQEKASNETEGLLEEEEATEIVQDQGSGEKMEQVVSIADTTLNTASVPFSTADESVQKKSKKQLEQERLSHEEAIRLQEHIDEEERKRIARDAEIAKQLQEEYDKARKKEAITKVDTAYVIDWNDHSVISEEENVEHLKLILELLKKEEFFAIFTFGLRHCLDRLMPSCDLVSFDNMILYSSSDESFISEFAEVFALNLKGQICLPGSELSYGFSYTWLLDEFLDGYLGLAKEVPISLAVKHCYPKYVAPPFVLEFEKFKDALGLVEDDVAFDL